jgi:prolyl 4-hydroxylase
LVEPESGSKHRDDYFDSRTSSNAWCTGDCYADEIVTRVHKRLESLTHIPEANYEYLQLLRYYEGQFYSTYTSCTAMHATRVRLPVLSFITPSVLNSPRFSTGEHNDYIPFHLEHNQGVRILTIFLYLNDVEAGGGTKFPDLNIVRACFVVEVELMSLDIVLSQHRFGESHISLPLVSCTCAYYRLSLPNAVAP